MYSDCTQWNVLWKISHNLVSNRCLYSLVSELNPDRFWRKKVYILVHCDSESSVFAFKFIKMSNVYPSSYKYSSNEVKWEGEGSGSGGEGV